MLAVNAFRWRRLVFDFSRLVSLNVLLGEDVFEFSRM